MANPLFFLRELPKYDAIVAKAKRYPDIDPDAVIAWCTLLRVASDVLAEHEATLAKHGFSQGRWSVLMILNCAPEVGLCPADIANKCGVTRATVTGLLDGLEGDGWIEKEAHASDRRMTTVLLTDKAKKFLDEILPNCYKRLAMVMSPLNQKEKRQLVELLMKLGAGLSGDRAEVEVEARR